MEEKFQEIPTADLSEEALGGIIKDFILREGTDYGEKEFTLDDKITQIKAQLESGKARVVFDLESETCTILTSAALSSVKIS